MAVRVLVLDMTKSPRLVERNCSSVQTLHRSARYAGAEPYFTSNISTHSLYTIRFSTGSQCRFRKRGVARVSVIVGSLCTVGNRLRCPHGEKCVNNTGFFRETGEPFHHLITWQDLRASEYVKQWNDSYTMKVCAPRLCEYFHLAVRITWLVPVLVTVWLH